MPVHYIIYKEHRLAITTGEGYITADEIKAHQDQLLGDPDFDPTFNQLIDVTNAADLYLNVGEMKEVSRLRIVSGSSKRAYLAKSIHVAAVGRVMEIYHEAHHEVEVHVFEDRHEALQWLGIEEDSLS